MRSLNLEGSKGAGVRAAPPERAAARPLNRCGGHCSAIICCCGHCGAIICISIEVVMLDALLYDEENGFLFILLRV